MCPLPSTNTHDKYYLRWPAHLARDVQEHLLQRGQADLHVGHPQLPPPRLQLQVQGRLGLGVRVRVLLFSVRLCAQCSSGECSSSTGVRFEGQTHECPACPWSMPPANSLSLLALTPLMHNALKGNLASHSSPGYAQAPLEMRPVYPWLTPGTLQPASPPLGWHSTPTQTPTHPSTQDPAGPHTSARKPCRRSSLSLGTRNCM